MYGDLAISAVRAALDTTAIQTQYQVAAAKKSLDAQRFMGEAAIQLIQSATIDPNVGANLNISV